MRRLRDSIPFGVPQRAIVVVALVLAAGRGSAQTLAPFPSHGWEMVYAAAVQADGKVLLGGNFRSLDLADGRGSFERRRIARVNPDGSIDPAFNPGADATVRCLGIQPDGKIVVGGDWNEIAGDRTHKRLARLNTDGTLDATFLAATSIAPSTMAILSDRKILVAGPGGLERLTPDGSKDSTFQRDYSAISAVAVLPDGKILVATAGPSASVRRHNADGSRDLSFPSLTAGLNVNALAVLHDGRILVGGQFASLGEVRITNLARLHADGTVDPSFAPAPDGTVHTLSLQADGKVVVGGEFAVIAGGQRRRAARLFADGSLDTSFTWPLPFVPAPDAISAILAGNGTIVGFGTFLFRLRADEAVSEVAVNQAAGTVTWSAGGTSPEITEATFETSSDGMQYAPLGTGTWVAGGWRLATAIPVGTKSVRARGLVAVQSGWYYTWSKPLRVDGTAPPCEIVANVAVPQSWVVGMPVQVSADVAPNQCPQAPTFEWTFGDGDSQRLQVARKVYSSPGTFNWKLTIQAADTSVTETGTIVVALPALPSLDALSTVIDGDGIRAMAVQPDGRIVIGGWFRAVGGVARRNIARLNRDGSVDGTFDPGADSGVDAIVLQPDGRLLIGGTFSSIGGELRAGVARLNADGSVDARFNANYRSASVFSIACQPDGRILTAGALSRLGVPYGVVDRVIERLNEDGSRDQSFEPRPNGRVLRLAVQPDGKILLGGEFTRVDSDFGAAARKGLARLDPTGSVDEAYDPAARLGTAGAFVLQPDGKLVAAFEVWTSAMRLYRVNADGSNDSSFHSPEAVGAVDQIAVQADGRILVAGYLLWFSEGPHFALTRLSPDGTIDLSCQIYTAGSDHVIAIERDGSVLLGGWFSRITIGPVDAVPRNGLARLYLDGCTPTSFEVRAATPVTPGGQWQSTGINVLAGNMLSIAAARGAQWTNGARSLTADGDPADLTEGQNCPLAGAPRMALIGRIGESGPPFVVGATYRQPAASSGILYLAPNDDWYWAWDNAGSVSASVCASSGPAACVLDVTANVPQTTTSFVGTTLAAVATASGCTGEVSYRWDFGDGHTGVLATETHQYWPGVFDWTLTASTRSFSTTRSGTITVHEFSGCRPTEVDISAATPGSPGSQWQSAGIVVQAGAMLSITVPADARWTKNGQTWTADGNVADATFGPNSPMPGAPRMALVGRIGPSGRPFLVGARYSGPAPASGLLYLAPNDDWYLVWGNSGTLRPSICAGGGGPVCSLDPVVSVPATATAGSPVTFEASASASGCVGTTSYG